jgi:hypothetical protein
MNVSQRKWTNEREGKPEQKFEAAFGTVFLSLELLSVFKVASELYIYLYF